MALNRSCLPPIDIRVLIGISNDEMGPQMPILHNLKTYRVPQIDTEEYSKRKWHVQCQYTLREAVLRKKRSNFRILPKRGGEK